MPMHDAPRPQAVKVPDEGMDARSLDFHRGIFEEHLIDAAFLYEQRLVRLGDAGLGWQDMADIDRRIDLRLDALMVGGDVALEVCAQHVADGDPGILFVAMSVFCRQRQSAPTAALLRGLDHAKAMQVQAVRRALCLELPARWVDFVEKALAGHPAVAALLAPVCAYRELPLGQALLTAFVAARHPPLAMVDALGQMKVREARGALENCLKDGSPAMRSSALLALCRIGAPEPLKHSHAWASSEVWPRVSMGLGGDRQAVEILTHVARTDAVDASCLHALGLLGDVSALAPLCDALLRPELAAQAAQSLYWMTGADLFDATFVEEEVDEDALIGDELDAWRRHRQAPMRSDGTPFGETVVRLSQDPARWRAWLTEHAAGLNPKWRYRLGRPFSPVALAETLLEARSDMLLRHYTAQELAIRYACDIHFDVEMPVSTQMRSLDRIRSWASAVASEFEPGAWYFAGRAQ